MTAITEHVLDGHEHTVSDGVTTMHLGCNRKYHYVYAPPGIDGLGAGEKLRVLHQFTTDESCPYGAGLTCLKLEARMTVLFTPQGVAWLRHEL